MNRVYYAIYWQPVRTWLCTISRSLGRKRGRWWWSRLCTHSISTNIKDKLLFQSNYPANVYSTASGEKLTGDLLFGLKFVKIKLPILPTLFIHFVQGRRDLLLGTSSRSGIINYHIKSIHCQGTISYCILLVKTGIVWCINLKFYTILTFTDLYLLSE